MEEPHMGSDGCKKYVLRYYLGYLKFSCCRRAVTGSPQKLLINIL